MTFAAYTTVQSFILLLKVFYNFSTTPRYLWPISGESAPLIAETVWQAGEPLSHLNLKILSGQLQESEKVRHSG